MKYGVSSDGYFVDEVYSTYDEAVSKGMAYYDKGTRFFVCECYTCNPVVNERAVLDDIANHTIAIQGEGSFRYITDSEAQSLQTALQVAFDEWLSESRFSTEQFYCLGEVVLIDNE